MRAALARFSQHDKLRRRLKAIQCPVTVTVGANLDGLIEEVICCCEARSRPSGGVWTPATNCSHGHAQAHARSGLNVADRDVAFGAFDEPT